MSSLRGFCPECNSTDITIHVLEHDQFLHRIPCTCNKCGNKFEIMTGLWNPQSLLEQKLVKTREHNKMEQTWTQDMEKFLKELNFDWRKNGPLIPLFLMFAFTGLVFVAQISYNSWLSTPYSIAAILSGLIYLVLIIYRKMNTPKYRHVR